MVDTSFFLPKVRKRPTFRQVASALGLWLGLTFLATLVVHFVIVFALPTIGRGVLIDEVIPPGESAPRLYRPSR